MLNKIRRATWNTSKTCILKFDNFYMHTYMPKRGTYMIKFNQKMRWILLNMLGVWANVGYGHYCRGAPPLDTCTCAPARGGVQYLTSKKNTLWLEPEMSINVSLTLLKRSSYKKSPPGSGRIKQICWMSQWVTSCDYNKVENSSEKYLTDSVKPKKINGNTVELWYTFIQSE